MKDLAVYFEALGGKDLVLGVFAAIQTFREQITGLLS